MSPIPVVFEYHTGVSRPRFAGATLVGGWDAEGRPSPEAWTPTDMVRRAGIVGDVCRQQQP